MNTFVARNKDNTWVVRCLEGEYAITNRPGCYTLYLHTPEQKVTFVHALKTALNVLKTTTEELACLYTGWIAVYLTEKDIEFLLENIKLTDTEKQLASTEIKNNWQIH